MRTNAFSGEAEDDPEKFFRRSAWDVSSADLWRWRACTAAMRDIQAERRRLYNG